LERWLLPLLIVFAGGYGYHRDELYFLVAGEHLAWAYPDQGDKEGRRRGIRARREASMPYRLRGSFVSLLLWEGRSLTYVAEQAGHSVATLAKHYAGVLRELEEQPQKPASEVIRSAREEVRCSPDPSRQFIATPLEEAKSPQTRAF
jgi:hypothetical protein